MSITVSTLKDENDWTVGKVILIDTKEEYREFQQLIQRGAGTWPDASAEIKEAADLITSEKVMQDYKGMTKDKKHQKYIDDSNAMNNEDLDGHAPTKLVGNL